MYKRMVTILFWLFVFCVAGFAVAFTLNWLGNRWFHLPHFVYNRVGSIVAICSVADWKRAIDSASLDKSTDWAGPKSRAVVDTEGGQLLRIRDTVALSQFAADSHYWGSYDARELPPKVQRGNFYPMHLAENLFVPFASGRYMLFDDQEKFFTGPQDLVEFADRKREENYQNDWRMRFARWKTASSIGNFVFWFGCTAVVAGFGWAWGAINAFEKANPRMITTYLAAKDGSIQKTVSTEDVAFRALVSPGIDGTILVKGHVTQMVYVGGGSSRACIRRENGLTNCGFADSSLKLKIGDIAYLQSGKLLLWTGVNAAEMNTGIDSWYISKETAQALVAVGKFEILE